MLGAVRVGVFVFVTVLLEGAADVVHPLVKVELEADAELGIRKFLVVVAAVVHKLDIVGHTAAARRKKVLGNDQVSGVVVDIGGAFYADILTVVAPVVLQAVVVDVLDEETGVTAGVAAADIVGDIAHIGGVAAVILP
ncbi:Uncharacterised protein [uncultured Ruminococcus sp.]|nr:Uncharacterised protein [uncultured Ruminococcus sp.]